MTVDLRHALREHFGFDDFRKSQRDVIEHIVGGGDALVIMATGDGKSLCYQLPALVLPGLTIVVSPLIALMDDQVLALERKGLPATCIHSMLDAKTRKQRLQRALDGEIKLLYVTPERFRVGKFLEQIQTLSISLFAIDEAHCLSQWGHDFRPDYKRLGEVRETLGSPPTLALTATATPEVQGDITRVLGIDSARLFHTGIERPNLFLSVHPLERPDQKLDRVLEVIEEVGGPGIIYHALIKDLLQTETALLRRGIKPLVYHGKLSANERREQQKRFIDSKDALILATNAFGMGVDKPNIRFILHYQVPRTLESYYQEIGRAGRDGKAAICELLYCEEDVSIQREFTEWANPDQAFMRQVVQYLSTQGERLHATDIDEIKSTFLVKNRRDGRVETCLRLLTVAGCCAGELTVDFEWLRSPTSAEIEEWLPDDKRKRDLMGLLEMVRYAATDECRKRYIHRYFGFDEFEDGCGSCDHSAAVATWLHAELPASQRTAIPKETPKLEAAKDARVERGDWIDVRGHGLCAVIRVHVQGKSIKVDVERAKDLQQRSFNLGKVRWRKV